MQKLLFNASRSFLKTVRSYPVIATRVEVQGQESVLSDVQRWKCSLILQIPYFTRTLCNRDDAGSQAEGGPWCFVRSAVITNEVDGFLQFFPEILVSDQDNGNVERSEMSNCNETIWPRTIANLFLIFFCSFLKSKYWLRLWENRVLHLRGNIALPSPWLFLEISCALINSGVMYEWIR